MEALDQQGALKVITLFSGAVKGMAFYPTSHPAIHRPLIDLDKILAQALSRSSEVSWGIIDGAMFFEDHLFATPSTAIADLTNRLLERDIGRIIMTAGISFDELQAFVSLMSIKGTTFDVLSELMQQKKITRIRLVQQGKEVFDTPVDEDVDGEDVDGDSTHIATYNKALDAIRGICRDIERGRIPNSSRVIKIVDRMVGITMDDPSTLLGLTMIKDYDNYTFNHCVNVGVLAMALGATLGFDAASVRSLGIAGQLHDIGKTMVPKSILNKPGKLSSIEYEEMKRHSELGAKIIREMEDLSPDIAQIVLGHHLHFNRSGYPNWAQKLPFNQLVDVVSIADTYDAITTLRVYHHPVNPRSALTEMQSLVGTILDGNMVTVFTGMMGKYPVGTMVRLDTNEVAVVYRPNPLDEETPIVRILIDGDGTRLAVPREQMLVESNGTCYATIVAIVDPLLKNIDVSRFITSGHF